MSMEGSLLAWASTTSAACGLRVDGATEVLSRLRLAVESLIPRKPPESSRACHGAPEDRRGPQRGPESPEKSREPRGPRARPRKY